VLLSFLKRDRDRATMKICHCKCGCGAQSQTNKQKSKNNYYILHTTTYITYDNKYGHGLIWAGLGVE
jgi:hypothetical protein